MEAVRYFIARAGWRGQLITVFQSRGADGGVDACAKKRSRVPNSNLYFIKSFVFQNLLENTL